MDGQFEILEPQPHRSQQQVGGWRAYKLGWLAYYRPVMLAFIRVFVLSIVPAMLLQGPLKMPQWGTTAIVVGALLNLAIFVYDVLYLRSVVFFTDENGVWLAKGLLPWNKGVSGVKWRDVSEAVFFQGFASWLLKTYTVRVGHKFTNDTELRVPNVRNGHDAVQHVNDVLMNPRLYFG